MRYDVGRFRRPMRRGAMEQMVSLISLGDGSTLSLDFTAMSSLDSRFTFTRNSIATFINSSGLVQQVSAAPSNDPTKARFDYDPSTLAPRGLLIESSATNLLNFSESFAASGGTNNNWTDSNITRATGNTDPAGGATAVRFTASAGNATVISSAAIGTTASRTFSIFLRRVTGTGNIQYTLDNGSTYTTQAITGSWVRYTFAATSANHQVGIRIVTSGDAIEMWGAQLEATPQAGVGFATSYIPTGTSQVQRAADICDMTGTNFSSWFVSGSPYSMLFKYSMNNPSAWAGSNVDRGAGLLSASGYVDPRVFVNAAYRVASGSGDIGRFIRVYDSGTLDMSPGTYPAAASNTALAFAVDTNNSAVYGANQVVGTDSTNTLLTGYTQFAIGRVGGSSQHINGCISQIKYWPQRLPNATLQGLVV